MGLHFVMYTIVAQLGAVVHKDVGAEVTHVVARRLGTEKVLWAQQQGRFVVGIDWLVFSGARGLLCKACPRAGAQDACGRGARRRSTYWRLLWLRAPRHS